MQLEKEIARAIKHIAASDTQSSPSIDEQARIALGELYEPMMMIMRVKEMDPVQARMPFYLNIH